MFSGESNDHFSSRLKKYNEVRKALVSQGKTPEEVKEELDEQVERDRKVFEGRQLAGDTGGSVVMATEKTEQKTSNPDAKDKGQSSNSKGKVEEIKAAQGDISDFQIARLEALKEWYRANMRPSDVANPLMQSGLKQMEVTDKLKEDSTNLYSRPALNTLLKWNRAPVSQNIATAEDIAQITSKLESMGVPRERVRDAIFDIVLYAAHNSSSPFQTFEGDIDFRDPKFKSTFSRVSVSSIIKDHSTLRKVCRLFAPIVWSYMIINNEPPANWQAKGFPENAKFASFDTFDFVTNHSAMKPLEGLVRLPTDIEKLAHDVHKTNSLNKARRNEKLLSTSSKISGGQQACEVKGEFKGNGSCS
ncbi:coat protein [Melon yellowing-associated virus]|uniref:Capsid protein n=1 Tax=Melon yellowing-associated virus TaxID=255255 RepID=A0A1W7HH39_9VIRU|nr:coat protein [Melon yellowing-associated virus]BAX36556.1 coat protein [Melon yellowing-associated virus]